MSELNESPEGEVEAGVTPETVEAVETEAEDQHDEESATSEDVDQGDEKPKRKSRAQDRINELTREKYERDRQIAEMQRQLQEAQQRQSQEPQQPVDDMPRLADFGYDEDQYRQAVHQWNQQKIQAYQDQQQQTAQQQRQMAEQQRQQQLLQEKIHRASEKYPDFIQKVNDPSLPPLQEVSPTAFQAILESDAGADVAYYLANNPQEIYRLASLSPLQTVREITLLEGRLQTTPPKQVRTPPKPPSTVSEGTSEAVTDPSKMDIDTWMKWRNSQLQQR